jgi:hypothetical protein
MKSKIYLTGLAAALLVFLGILFKIQHWPGASITLTSGLFILLFVFLPFALWSNYKAEGAKGSGVLYVVVWITCFVVITSMLFKIQHWPGAGFMLLVAIPFPFVVFLPVYLIVTGRNKNHNIFNSVAILFLLAISSALAALLSLGVTKEKLIDSLLYSANYLRTEKALGPVSSESAASALTVKIDEALRILDELENQRLLNEGITQQQWHENPEYLLFHSLRPAGAKSSTVNTSELYESLQSQLSDIIVLVKGNSFNEHLAGNIPDILNMKKSTGDEYYIADPLINSSIQPWPFVYLDGLRVKLMMLKITAG